MVLNCKDLKKSFSDKILFKNCSFHIEDNEKAAIVGINGAGKTTLLRMIIGNETYEEGMITLSKDSTIGYLAQNQSVKSNHSIYDELLSVKQNLIQLEERMRSLEIAMKTSSEVELEQLMKQYSNATHQFEIQNGYSYRSEVIGVLKGLGFDEVDFNRDRKSVV